MSPERRVDLRSVPSAHVPGEVLAAVCALARGERLRLVTGDDPGMALRSANLHLHQALDWQSERTADGAWTALVRFVGEHAFEDPIATLFRDHRAFDRALARVLGMLNAGDAGAAAVAFAAFADRVARHVEVEDRLLAPLVESTGGDSDGAVALMRREHADITVQSGALSEALAEGEGALGAACALAAILSGTLAKHEHREEAQLFPRWRAALARMSVDRRTALARAVCEGLGHTG